MSPPDVIDEEGEQLLERTRADFDLPPVAEYPDFRPLGPENLPTLMTEAELRETIAFQASCAWMRFLVTEVTASRDLTVAADGIQDLNERPEIDPVLRRFLTDAVVEGRIGRTTTADQFIAANCSPLQNG